jgi:outer membrane biosynthesis protein TonB
MKEKLCFIVIFAHVLIASVSLLYKPEIERKKPLVIKTFQEKKTAKVISTGSKPVSSSPKKTPPVIQTQKKAPPAKPKNPPAPPKPKEIKKTVKQELKKVEPKPPKKQEPKPTPKPKDPIPLPEKTKTDLLQKSLKEIQTSLSKIEETQAKTHRATQTSSILEDSLEDNYASTLSSYLERNLHLPDFGEVKIELTLKEDGTVEKIRVLASESEQNKKRIEKDLPNLRFPRPPSTKKESDSKTFILVFCNQI